MGLMLQASREAAPQAPTSPYRDPDGVIVTPPSPNPGLTYVDRCDIEFTCFFYTFMLFFLACLCAAFIPPVFPFFLFPSCVGVVCTIVARYKALETERAEALTGYTTAWCVAPLGVAYMFASGSYYATSRYPEAWWLDPDTGDVVATPPAWRMQPDEFVKQAPRRFIVAWTLVAAVVTAILVFRH